MLDVVSRYWLSTVVSAEESSTQVQVAFTDALIADGKAHLLEDDQLLEELASGVVPDNDERVPVLLAISGKTHSGSARSGSAFPKRRRIRISKSYSTRSVWSQIQS